MVATTAGPRGLLEDQPCWGSPASYSSPIQADPQIGSSSVGKLELAIAESTWHRSHTGETTSDNVGSCCCLGSC